MLQLQYSIPFPARDSRSKICKKFFAALYEAPEVSTCDEIRIATVNLVSINSKAFPNDTFCVPGRIPIHSVDLDVWWIFVCLARVAPFGLQLLSPHTRVHKRGVTLNYTVTVTVLNSKVELDMGQIDGKWTQPNHDSESLRSGLGPESGPSGSKAGVRDR